MAQATVPSFAKINLDLRVLGTRADGYHELRTIFQTISLKDTLRIEFERARKTSIEVESSIDIPDNLVVRAARMLLDGLKVSARVRFVLKKRIPMGAGLGGGSSNAAAVLLALPELAGKKIERAQLFEMAESLGSDVPFFLHGGTVLGLARGTELYPLPDQAARSVLIVSTGVHVSTKQAYAALGRDVTDALTSPRESRILREFQTLAWGLDDKGGVGGIALKNDFEAVVFERHPEVRATLAKLSRLGARPARMTGSGSALFGIFGTRAEALVGVGKFPAGSAFAVSFVPRRMYERLWRKALSSHN